MRFCELTQQTNHQNLTLDAENIPSGPLGVAANELENGETGY